MIQIKNQNFRAEKMAPRDAMHVMRRLTPLLKTAGPAIMAFLVEDLDKGEAMARVVECIGPFTDVLATLPDSEVDYVMDHCLLKVQRQDEKAGTWHPIYIQSPRGLVPMFAPEIDAVMEVRLVGECIKENLSGFFGQLSEGIGFSLNANSPDPKSTQTTPEKTPIAG